MSITIGHLKTKHIDERDVSVVFSEYKNKQIAIVLKCSTGEPLATATICMPGYEDRIPAGHVVIKDYSENEGLLDALVDCKLIETTKMELVTGYTLSRICKLLVTP